MSITLSPEAEALIQSKVETGRYGSPTEVVLAALQLLEEREKLDRLKEMIAGADAQIARGDGIPWTSETVDRLKREASANVRSGKPIKDEVKP